MTVRSVIHSGLISLKHESLCLDFFLACGSSQVALGVQNSSDSAGDLRDAGLIPGSGRSPEEGHGNPLQCSCLENPHGERSLAGYSPQGHKESDMTE